jgi:hypothetical protein
MTTRRTALPLALLVALACAALAAEPPKDADKPLPEIKVGMRIKSTYAGSLYKGVLKEIKDKDTYVIRSDGYETDSTVPAWRLQTEDGVEFLDLIKDPQRMAQRERDKLAGKDYFVGVWNTSNNPVFLTTKSETRADGTVVETKEYNLTLVKGLIHIKADGTYEHMMYSKDRVAGAWAENPDQKEGGIVLTKGHLLGGDLKATRQPLGTILLQNRELGGAGYTGTIVPAKSAESGAKK